MRSYSKQDQLARPRQRQKADKGKESDLQRKCEELLEWKHIPIIRIPDDAYRVIFANPHINNRDRAIISRFLKGLPDITMFRKLAEFLKVFRNLADRWENDEDFAENGHYMDGVYACVQELKELLGELEQLPYSVSLCA